MYQNHLNVNVVVTADMHLPNYSFCFVRNTDWNRVSFSLKLCLVLIEAHERLFLNVVNLKFFRNQVFYWCMEVWSVMIWTAIGHALVTLVKCIFEISTTSFSFLGPVKLVCIELHCIFPVNKLKDFNVNIILSWILLKDLAYFMYF